MSFPSVYQRLSGVLAALIAVLAIPLPSAAVTVPVSGGGDALLQARAANLAHDVTFEIQDSETYVGSFFNNLRFHIRAIPGTNPTIQGDATLSSSVIYYGAGSGGSSLGSNDGGTITILQGASDFYSLRFEAVGSSGTMEPVRVENVIFDGAGTGGFSKMHVYVQNFGAVDLPTKVDFDNVVFDRKGSAGYVMRAFAFSTPTEYQFTFNNCTFLDVGTSGAAFYSDGAWGSLDFTRCKFDLGAGARGIYLGNTADALPSASRHWTVNLTECCVETVNGQGIRVGGAVTEFGDYAQVTITRSVLVDFGIASGNNIDVGVNAVNAVISVNQSDLIRGGDPTTPTNVNIRAGNANATVSILDSNIIGHSNLINNGEPSTVATADYSLILVPPTNPGVTANWVLGANMISGGPAPAYNNPIECDFRYTNVNQTASSTGGKLGSDLFLGEDDPLLIQLDHFGARSAGVGYPVRIGWTTASEIDNVGFHVNRLRFEDGHVVAAGRVNSSLIPGAGTTADGASYSLLDPVPLAEGERRGYVLVDIDANGNHTRHGPFGVHVSASDPAGESDWQLY